MSPKLRLSFTLILLHLSVVFLLGAAPRPQQDLIWDEAPADNLKTTLHSKHSKIVWWNTGCAWLNRIMVKQHKQKDSLFTNIFRVAQLAQPPDIFILGEYCPGITPVALRKTLEKIYPHRFHLPRVNPHKETRNGMLVLSKWPLEVVKQEFLEIGSDKEIKAGTRPYLLLKVKQANDWFYLSPVHFYNPWHNLSGFDLLLSVAGTDNLNYKQATLYRERLAKDVDLSKDRLVVIGDFNSAKNIYGVADLPTFDLFQEWLEDRSQNKFTYPSATARRLGNEYPDLIIDHAFTRGIDGSSVALPLKGSDHYPLLFTW